MAEAKLSVLITVSERSVKQECLCETRHVFHFPTQVCLIELHRLYMITCMQELPIWEICQEVCLSDWMQAGIISGSILAPD